MREMRDYQEKIFDKEFEWVKLGTNIDVITDDIQRTLQKMREVTSKYYNLNFGRKDENSICYGIISDNNGRESIVRLFEKDKVEKFNDIGRSAIVLIDYCNNKDNITKESFIEQSVQSLMKEYLSIVPSEKNTMRRKDIINMIEQLNRLNDDKINNSINNVKLDCGTKLNINENNYIITKIKKNENNNIYEIILSEENDFIKEHGC